MKRKFSKILGVGLTLALLTSLLVTAAPVAAQGDATVTLRTYGNGTAEWSTDYARTGSYSLKLFAPATTGDYGIVVMPLDMEFEELADFSVYVEGGAVAAQALPLHDIKAVVDATGISPLSGGNNHPATDVNLSGKIVVLASQPGQSEALSPTLMSDGIDGFQKYGTHGDADIGVGTGAYWSIFVYSASYVYEACYDYYTWDEIHSVLDDYATVTEVRVELRYPQNPADVDSTVYVDDILINGVTYDLEPRVINTTTPAGFSNIQDAIDAADPGDTITVADGTYTEDLTVNIADLTLKSVSGMASTTIQLVDGVGIDIQGGAADFTLGGASGTGFTISPHATATTFDIQLANAPSGVDISYNTIDTTGDASMGISVGAAGATGLTVSNNTFTAEDGDGSIWGPRMVDVTVDSNTISGGSYGIQFSGVTGTSTISNNTISGCTGSGAIMISNGEATSGLAISSNTVSGCANGIRFAEYCAVGTAGNMTTVTVTQNTLTTNAKAIQVGDGAHVLASNFTIEYNDISGSTTFGLENENTLEVTAENNWWGAANGPEHAVTNPGGLGDAVSDNVDFTPWLLSEGGEPVVTYTDYISVPDGWSLISPDRAWADWEALGSDLVLTYDTDILVPAFVEPQSSSLSPLSAIYIKTTGGGLLGMNYPDYDLGMYATNLEVGWNLIGIPATVATEEAILSPIRLNSSGDAALATLVSQGNYNPSGITFYQDTLSLGTFPPEVVLSPFDGYWAYMNVAKEFGVIVVP